MAAEYASSPEAVPVLQILIVRVLAVIAGTTCVASQSHAGLSLKKSVTLIRILSNRNANSSGWT